MEESSSAAARSDIPFEESGASSPSAASRHEQTLGLQALFSAIAVRSLSSGFRRAGPGDENPSPLQLVTEHQIEIFMQRFPRWIAALELTSCISAMAEVCLLVWLIISYAKEQDQPCDAPLKTFAIGEFISSGYGLIQIPIISCVLWLWCRRSSSDDTEILPLPARIYTLVIILIDWGWVAFGIDSVRKASTCQDTAPQLYKSSVVYAYFCLVDYILVTINAVGLYRILNFMLRRGLLTSEDAAPPGTVEKLRLVAYDANEQVFKDNPECCICLGNFGGNDADAQIRMTHCGHIFHGKCLGNWLRMKRACPLCRRDVTAEFNMQASREAEVLGRRADEPLQVVEVTP